MRQKVHGVPLVDADVVQLGLAVDLARDVDAIGLELSLELVEELHVAPLVVDDWNWTVIYVRLQQEWQVEALGLDLVVVAQGRDVQLNLHKLRLLNVALHSIVPILDGSDILLVEEVVDCLAVVVFDLVLQLDYW